MEQKSLGKRIAVVGVSSSGKSTFARKLAAKTNLPLTHIDAVMWKPGWDYIGDEATVQELKKISQGDAWIVEGFINKNALAAVLECADTIVYLDYPRYVPALRYFKRWFMHRKTPRPELAGCPDKLSFKFLKRVWDRKEMYRLNHYIETMTDTEKIVRLRSPKEAERFVSA